MNKTIAALALPLISNLTSVSFSAALETAADWRPQITVQVYNAAGVTPSVVLKAEHEADWIFGKAGIRVNWMSCHFDPESVKAQDCRETADPLLFVLRINPGRASAVVSVEALGFALPFTDNARHGAVNYQNVEAVYQKNRDLVDLYRLLANVMVHELTHLIFESTRHSEGLMHANWSRTDLKRMGKRQLALTPEQVRQIRDALIQRASRPRKHSLASSTVHIAHGAYRQVPACVQPSLPCLKLISACRLSSKRKVDNS
ncbi:MAG: hypothetical protein ACR2IV_12140 [Bryobacteraceae bacterium]